jgi:tetratricopeptide (TPR) repeat protein
MAQVALRDYLGEIDDLIEHGQVDAAVQHCRHILKQHPKAVEVYRMLGKALLEQEEDRAAQDVFQRVLSVDPEDFLARVGLSIIHDRNNELEAAIWHMERAFDLAPSNSLIQGELRRLYAQRDGEAPARIPLSRGALARLYAQGDLNAEAISDLNELLNEQPARFDLQVQMAEVLWRDDRRVDAAEHAQTVQETLPYCLKANLILGAILFESGGPSESAVPFQHAQAVDPENDLAERLFAGQGPLRRQDLLVDRLPLVTIGERLEAPVEEIEAEGEEVPDWLRGLTGVEQPLEEETGAPLLAAAAGLHMPDVATEVPDWLQGLTAEQPSAPEAEVPDWLTAMTGAAVAGAAARALSEQEEPAAAEELAFQAAVTDEVVPDWISQLGAVRATETPQLEEEEHPSWLAQLEETTLPEPYSTQVPEQVDTQTPDWLAQLEAAQPAPTPPEEETTPDWLAQLQASHTEPAAEQAFVAEAEEEEPSALVPGLTAAALASLFAEEAEEPSPAALEAVPQEPFAFAAPPIMPEPVAAPETEAPAVLPEEMPSADDALAFLAKLAAGKEDELQAQAQAEADMRMAEIMGRKPIEVKPEEKPSTGAIAAGAALAGAAVAGLAAAAREEKPVEEEEPQFEERPAPPAMSAPLVSPAPPEAKAEVPAALPEEMPSADDALAFLAKLAAGKEDELRAQAQAEADLRMAEIMGRKAAPAVAVAAVKEEEKPAPPPEAKAEVLAALPEEMPSADDALAFLAKLAAGKEDELRAQAQAEADMRMAEIMGRKPVEIKPAEPEPAEKKPVKMTVPAATVAAVAAGLAAQKPEKPAPVTPAPEAKAEIPEAMPTADDALAFLAKLAAGKEDELRAQAQAEADVRMAEIMGRKPAEAKPAELKAEEQPPAGAIVAGAAAAGAVVATLAASPQREETLEVEAPGIEAGEFAGTDAVLGEGATEPAAAAELPDWLHAMRPAEAAVGIAEIEEAAAVESAEEELPEWLKAMRPAVVEPEATPTDEIPDWLKAMQPGGPAEGTAGLAALFEETAPEVTLPEEPAQPEEAALAALFEEPAQPEVEAAVMMPEGELPDWLKVMQPAGPSVEIGEAVEEIVVETSAPLAQTAELLSMDWWVQAAYDTDEEPLTELPAPYISPRAQQAARQVAKERERVPLEAKETARDRSKVGIEPSTGPLRQTGSLSEPAILAVSADAEPLQARLRANDHDHAARLDLARTYWSTGNRDGSFAAYTRLTEDGEFAREVLSDLETIVEVSKQADWRRLLGDAYMRNGKLALALEQYRLALNDMNL